MPFELSEEQALIAKTARDFADQALQPVAGAMDREARFPREVREGLAELGLWGLLVPAEQGGAGLDLVSLCVALEELARRSGSAAVVVASHNVAARALPVTWQSKTASSEALASLCLGDGPLATGLRGEQALEGSARLFPLAGQADVALTPHPLGGWAVVPKGLALAAWVPEGTLGLRGAELGQLVLRGARPERIEAELGTARSLGLAAIAVGLGQAAVEESARFAKDRIQFNRPISSFEGVRARLADMATSVDASRAAVLVAAAMADRAEHSAPRLAAQAKVMATEAASQSTRAAIRLHGGSGFLKDFAAERLNRDARMLPLLGGDTWAQRDAAARALLG